MDKITKQIHMEVAQAYAKLSYAKRDKVGCVIVKADRIISFGYNHMPPGWGNACEDESKGKGEDSKSFPEVYHAEINAITKLAQSHENTEGASLFVTHTPCLDCAKIIAQAGIQEVYYNEEYRKDDGMKFLKKCKIKIKQVSMETFTEKSVKWGLQKIITMKNRR